MGNVPSTANADPVLNLLPRNERGCAVGTACGQCGVCTERARRQLATLVIKHAREQRKGIEGTTNRKRAHARLSWALEALALVPEDASENTKERVRDSALRSEMMLAVGQKGTMFDGKQ